MNYFTITFSLEQSQKGERESIAPTHGIMSDFQHGFLIIFTLAARND